MAGTVIALCFSCNDYSVSEKQAESFLKYFAIDVEDNEGSEVIQTPSSGYLIMANCIQQGIAGSDKDILLIFCDEFGRMSNNSPVLLGTNGFDKGNSIINTGDGFIIAGSSQIGTQKQGFLSRIDYNGQLIWQHNYGGYPEMEFNEVMQHQDGGYIMTGYIMGNDSEKDVILYKTDSEGDSLWIREEGYGGYNDVGESLEKYQDRLLIVGTSSPVNPLEHSRLLILNSNLEGKGIIPKWIAGEKNLSGKEIILNPLGDLFIMGNEMDPLSGDSRIYLAKPRLTGSGLEYVEINEYQFLEDINSVWGEDLESTESGGMAICGWESRQQDINIYFVHINNNFQIINRQTFGSKGYQAARGLYYTSDEGFSLTGSVDLGGGRTTMLLKLNDQGKLQ